MARKSNANLIRIGLVGMVVLLAGGFWLHELQEGRKATAATAAAWMITGPACPSPAPGAATPPLPKQMAFDEVAIAREVGGTAACNTIKENGNGATLTICQFFAPGAIKVTTKKGTYSFAPERGVDASLVVRDDVPSCVLHVNPALLSP
ncbi:MAG TPA: hypothetical protein VL460_08535 [Caulobacteraceae bacterium]|jgi:hypothetical protein|nr:hypothetical protein [Caulobacteraceae bacterium]